MITRIVTLSTVTKEPKVGNLRLPFANIHATCRHIAICQLVGYNYVAWCLAVAGPDDITLNMQSS